jgi:YcaO-like protein with predicted kinase domain
VAWTSNGSGAHPRRDAALLHALLEAIERDQLARALPRGWCLASMRRLLSLQSLEREAPRTFERAREIAAKGFEIFLFDLSPARSAGGLGLPVAGALLFDAEEGPVPLTAGYACALRRDEALLGALLEAAQSRLTDIHGAREDVTPASRPEAERLRRLCQRARSKRSASEMADLEESLESPARGVQAVLRRLRRAGLSRAAAVDVAPRSLGVPVVKVVVPGLVVSELL